MLKEQLQPAICKTTGLIKYIVCKKSMVEQSDKLQSSRRMAAATQSELRDHNNKQSSSSPPSIFVRLNLQVKN
jgi:hypothetical protein